MPGFSNLRDERGAALYLSRLPRVRTAQETAAEIVRCFSGVVFQVLEDAARRPLLMSVDSLSRWHRATFRSTFPEHAGRFRDDEVSFGVRWREDGRKRQALAIGTPVERMYDELEAAFDAYNDELAARGPERRSARDAALAAATLYGELLRIHPFPDGNLRACFPALQGALVSLGGDPVHFDGVLDEHDEALGWALRSDADQRTAESFADLLLSRAITSSLRLTRLRG